MTDTAPAPTPPTTLVTGHVGLSVTDLDRSKAFYEQVFGFATQSEGTEADRRWAFLGAEGKVRVTLWQQSTGRYDTAPSGLTTCRSRSTRSTRSARSRPACTTCPPS